jgi:hypothetical protein
MSDRIVWPLLLALSLLPGGCGKKPDLPAATARGQQALAPFKGKLRDALTGALAKGPEQAVEVCAVEAPKLAAEASKDGVRVGRASARNRNPANAPEGWRGEAITHFQGMENPAGVFSRVLPSGAVVVAEPILTQPMCLTCHGKQLDPALAEKIRGRYPGDQATGYEAGQLRGIFWAEVDPR